MIEAWIGYRGRIMMPSLPLVLSAAASSNGVFESLHSFLGDLNHILFWVLAVIAGLLMAGLGYLIGKWLGRRSQTKYVAEKEKELFSAQKGFKTVHDSEMKELREENESLTEKLSILEERIEEYRKKAAGYGGLFGSSKNADAMYALLLENEALEEALQGQNEKLASERSDSVKEQLRAAGYRRVLMSQLVEDNRFKKYAEEVYGADGQTPGNQRLDRQLPNQARGSRNDGPVQGEIEDS